MISEAVKELLQNDKELCASAVNMLIKIANNVINHPDDPKFRKINLNSEITENTLLPAIGALEILFLMGFEEGVDKLVLPEKASIETITSYRDQLQQLKSENVLEKHQPKQIGKQISSEDRIAEFMVMESDMKRELEHQFQQVLLFERRNLQEAARNAMPHQELCKKARELETKLKAENTGKNTPNFDFQDCILVELTSWFKEEFFSWFDQGYCNECARPMKMMGYVTPTAEELEFDGHRVENYECEVCKGVVRFPRYFHPGKLLETKKGRCMEWASCFTLMCRAVGLDARYIWDKTDHVWTEVFSISQNRWVHADPCENKVDTPLIYEKGWKKQLSYIFGFSKDEVVDCVWRYSSDHKAVCSRRTRCREDWLAQTLCELNQERQRPFPEAKKRFLELRAVKEIVDFFKEPKSDKKGECEGRLSGSLSWRLSRGETTEVSFTPYTFVPSEREIEIKELVVKYSPSQDIYVRENSDGEKVSGWKSLAFAFDNMFRKVEKDWNMVYLARKVGSENGKISWKFDWSSLPVKISSILVVFQHKTFENGSVQWQVCTGSSCFPGNQFGVLELREEELGGNCCSLEITADLDGGVSDVAWQHAQLFRQNLNDKEFPFFVKIKFI